MNSQKHRYYVIAGLALMAVLLACQLFEEPAGENTVATAAAQTMQARQPDSPPVVIPTITPLPQQVEPTTPPEPVKPCNKALFISETVPDHSEFSPNEDFTKTWRVENVGTCTWNTNYRIELQSGEAMGAGYTHYFPQIIHPGERMDVVLELDAPPEEGEYTSWWQLQDDQGKKFAQLYVLIEVK